MLSKRYESTEVDRKNLATCALGDSLTQYAILFNENGKGT